jgi:hypothetical protein
VKERRRRRDALFDNLKGCMSWAWGRQRRQLVIILAPGVSPAAAAGRADAQAGAACLQMVETLKFRFPVKICFRKMREA